MKNSGKDKTIGELLDDGRGCFVPLPPQPFDACRMEPRKVTSLYIDTYPEMKPVGNTDTNTKLLPYI